MKKNISHITLFLLSILVLSSCAYRFGSPERRIPGGYNLIAVPVFKNKTQEVAIESFFTQSMIMAVERSSLAQVTSKEESQAILLGEITSLTYESGTKLDSQSLSGLAKPAVLAKDYTIHVTVQLKLVRSSDMALLWEGPLENEKTYPAPSITTSPKNTANPLYNQSARMQNIQQISQDMMAEGFERLTENF